MSDQPAQPKDPAVEEWVDKKGRVPDAIKDDVVAARQEKKEKSLKVLKKTTKGIKQSDRLDLFMAEFVNNGGNATQAALKVFNCSTIESASSIGSQMVKKAKGLARLYMEKQGYHYGKMLEIAIDKMEKSKKPDWWDRLMKMADYEDFITKKQGGGPINVNVFQAHKDFASEYVEGEIEDAEPVEEPAQDAED